MTPADFSEPEREKRDFMGKTACFAAIIFLLSCLTWADIYEKIDELSSKCRKGSEAACAALSEIAKNDRDGNVRLAAAENLTDSALAQAIFANIAKYDMDAAVREAAIEKLTDEALLENLAKYGKDSAVREAAARKLDGEDLPKRSVGNVENKAESPEEEAEPVVKTTQPDLDRGPRPAAAGGKKMGIAAFMLRAGVNLAFGLGITRVKGDIYEEDKNPDDMTYLQYLRREIIKISEKTLAGNDVFSYVPARQLMYDLAEKAETLEPFLQQNGLQGALCVKTTLGVCVGWKKKVNLTTIWEMTTDTGYEIKIKTYSKSKKTHGMFPDTENPELEPVFVELAGENALQFLEQLAELMQEDENLR